MTRGKKVRVLFVCMGNICRSPTAQGIFRNLLEEAGLEALVEVDSAGTHAYHVGNPPDLRAQETARGRGLDLSDLRARQVCQEDFERYDYILAMDEDNAYSLSLVCPLEHQEKLGLLMDYAPHWGEREVPDPYYGGDQGFEQVFDMVEAACRGLLEEIRRRHLSEEAPLLARESGA
jgi:protein-tyrosine phosphatase